MTHVYRYVYTYRCCKQWDRVSDGSPFYDRCPKCTKEVYPAYMFDFNAPHGEQKSFTLKKPFSLWRWLNET